MTQTQPPLTAADKSAQGLINEFLHEFGLDELGAYAWQVYKQTGSVDMVHLKIQETPQYKTRFAGKLALNAKGFAMTEAEQLAYENQAQELMRAAGMPKGFYDNPADFQNLIGSGVSMVELGKRINDAYTVVSNAPQSVRDSFAQYYGTKGDNALASMVLDSNVALPIIQNHVAAAEAGGFLAQQHFQISKTLAERIATATGNSTQAIMAGSQEVGKLTAAGIDQARFNEAAPNQDQIVGAEFEGSGADAAAIQRTVDTRVASTAGGESIDTSRYGAAGLSEAGRT